MEAQIYRGALALALLLCPNAALGGGERESTRMHTVAAGDTLWGIAQTIGCRVDDVRRANGMNEASPLRVGDTLELPRCGGQAATQHVHTVGAGDTLSAIALRYKTTVPALVAAKALPDTTIRIGQRITVGALEPVLPLRVVHGQSVGRPQAIPPSTGPSSGLHGWQRTRPRQTQAADALALIAAHLPAFVERAEQAGAPPPKFALDELTALLCCGDFEHGFLRFNCTRCGDELRVPFACKARGTCPSCMGRRMGETAALCVEHLLPPVAYRQFVLSFDGSMAIRLGDDAELLGRVCRSFARRVSQSLRRRVKREHRHDTVATLHPGIVTVIQRFRSDLGLYVHLPPPEPRRRVDVIQDYRRQQDALRDCELQQAAISRLRRRT